MGVVGHEWLWLWPIRGKAIQVCSSNGFAVAAGVLKPVCFDRATGCDTMTTG